MEARATLRRERMSVGMYALLVAIAVAFLLGGADGRIPETDGRSR